MEIGRGFKLTLSLVPFNLKRIPAQPREARFVSAKFNVPQTIAPVAYETLL
jgi:large subunit ribosomal protein L21e